MNEALLPLSNLAERHPGITNAVGASYFEAACVCLQRHHLSPIKMTVQNKETVTVTRAAWEHCDQRTLDAWANETDATEDGAYAIVLAAVELECGMVAIRRAETRTGSDYYIAVPGTDPADLEEAIRLEVSGVDRGNESAVRQRLREKVKQALEGNSNLPALAGVAGFRAQIVALSEIVEK